MLFPLLDCRLNECSHHLVAMIVFPALKHKFKSESIELNKREDTNK